MKQKEYQKPQIDIVEIWQRTCLLIGSGEQQGDNDAEMEDYDRKNAQDW